VRTRQSSLHRIGPEAAEPPDGRLTLVGVVLLFLFGLAFYEGF
jgi:hypothetical protein